MKLNKSLLVVCILTLIGVLAAGFRLYDIQSYPPGLFPDEVANGEDARLILSGDLRVFYPRENGREALFFYLQAVSLAIFGVGVWPLKVVSALVGIATVIAIYFAARPWFGHVAGICSAFFLATSHWHVTLSRTGFRAILVPLFLALFVAFVGYAVQSMRNKHIRTSYVYAALAGSILGGGVYTYIAYRAVFVALIGVAVLVLVSVIHPKIRFVYITRWYKHVLTATLAACIVALPLGAYFIQNPDDFMGRAGQVSVFDENLQREHGGGTLAGALLYSASETLPSFFVRGDTNWRHNVAGYPLLNPLVSVLFFLALVWSLSECLRLVQEMYAGRKSRIDMTHAFLLLLLGSMLLPVLLTVEGLPHGLRSIGAIVPIFLLVGIVASFVVHLLAKWFPRELERSIAYGLVGGIVLFGVAYDGMLYFHVARNDADAHYAYRADLVVVSDYLNAHEKEEGDMQYLVLEEYSAQVVHFLTEGGVYDTGERPESDLYTLIDPGQIHEIRLGVDDSMVFTQSSLPDEADRYEEMYGEDIRRAHAEWNRFGQEVMRVYVRDVPEDDAPFDLDA